MVFVIFNYLAASPSSGLSIGAVASGLALTLTEAKLFMAFCGSLGNSRSIFSRELSVKEKKGASSSSAPDCSTTDPVKLTTFES